MGQSPVGKEPRWGPGASVLIVGADKGLVKERRVCWPML